MNDQKTLEDLETALTMIRTSSLRLILSKLARRHPKDFLEILSDFPHYNWSSQMEFHQSERIQRTPEELERDQELSDLCKMEATTLLDADKYIGAVKKVREVSGLDLKESKNFVEGLTAYVSYRMRNPFQ